MREPDVLDLAAREHRELHRALRTLLGPADLSPAPDRFDLIISSVARHEALDRLLLYPLVGRDAYGRRSLVERRAEQRSISDQLAKARRAMEEDPAAADMRRVLAGIQLTFTGHSDREEIEDFPQARRLSSPDERNELAILRVRVRDELSRRLPSVPAETEADTSAPEGRIGPVQVAIVRAKEILVEYDRTVIGAA